MFLAQKILYPDSGNRFTKRYYSVNSVLLDLSCSEFPSPYSSRLAWTTRAVLWEIWKAEKWNNPILTTLRRLSRAVGAGPSHIGGCVSADIPGGVGAGSSRADNSHCCCILLWLLWLLDPAHIKDHDKMQWLLLQQTPTHQSWKPQAAKDQHSFPFILLGPVQVHFVLLPHLAFLPAPHPPKTDITTSHRLFHQLS